MAQALKSVRASSGAIAALSFSTTEASAKLKPDEFIRAVPYKYFGRGIL
jgi:hypothetical protein